MYIFNQNDLPSRPTIETLLLFDDGIAGICDDDKTVLLSTIAGCTAVALLLVDFGRRLALWESSPSITVDCVEIAELPVRCAGSAARDDAMTDVLLRSSCSTEHRHRVAESNTVHHVMTLPTALPSIKDRTGQEV